MSKRTVQFEITAILEVEEEYLEDSEFDPKNFVDEMIRVKTGVYENVVMGYSTSIRKV